MNRRLEKQEYEQGFLTWARDFLRKTQLRSSKEGILSLEPFMTTYAAASKSPTLGQNNRQDVPISTDSSTNGGIDTQFANTGIANPYAFQGTAIFGFWSLPVDQRY